jgi:TetR/AcrR family transcriptional repressor of bet genes
MAKQAKKNKRKIEDIRRLELVEAAYRIFMKSGLKGLTTTRICNEAGMSQGILTYYFKDKDEVLFEMVRLANRILMNDVVSRLRLATTGWERVVAVIEGNFPPQRFDRNTANAWVSFYAEAFHNERYARLQHLFYRRLRSNLMPVLKPYLEREKIDWFLLGFASMLDGLWLRRGHSDVEITVDDAQRLLTDFTKASLGPELVKKLAKRPEI